MLNYQFYLVTVVITCCGIQFNTQAVCNIRNTGSWTDRTVVLNEMGSLPGNTKWTGQGHNWLLCEEFIYENNQSETNILSNNDQMQVQFLKNKHILHVNLTADLGRTNIAQCMKINRLTKHFSDDDDKLTYNEMVRDSDSMVYNQTYDKIYSIKKIEYHDELFKVTNTAYMNDGLTPHIEQDQNNCAVNDSINNERLSVVSATSNSRQMVGNVQGDIHKRPCVSDYHNTYKPTLAAENDYQSAIHGIDKDSALNCSGITHNFTVVSALFNLQREEWYHFQRTFDEYLDYSTQLLKMHIPLVLYVDQSVESFVKWHRRGKEHITQIIVTSIKYFEYYENYDVIKNIMDSTEFKQGHAFINHPEGFSPEYNILMNSKLSMLHEVSGVNYFNSSHFFWIDMGYGHGNDVYPENCHWSPNNLMYNDTVGDKITYIQLNPIDWINNIYDIYKQNIPPLLNGGFFGGSKRSIQLYYDVHKDMFKQMLSYGIVDDDQTLAVVCYYEEKQLFNLVNGWWYDAFKLFN